MIKNNYFVDIIMPNFNKSDYLDVGINSILNQTFKNWRLYILDDCSKDNSLNVLKKFKKFKKIKIIKLRKNKGPGFCRNYGLKISKSKYISFMDSDDYWKTDKLEKQINFMKINNLDFTYTDYIPFIQKKNKKKFLNKTNLKKTFNFNEFTKNSSINTTTMIITRSSIKGLKFKKISKLEDYLFKCELLKRGTQAYKFNASSAYYRILSNSRSSQKLQNIFYLWKINKSYNKFNFLENMLSIFMISLNSIKKYGFK